MKAEIAAAIRTYQKHISMYQSSWRRRRMIQAFLHGMMLPIGLILLLGMGNFFVFSQGAVRKRFIQVVPVVITASLCDTLLILIAVFGVYADVGMKTLLVAGGVIFLSYMGVITCKNSIDMSSGNNGRPVTTRKAIAFTLMVLFMNRHAILDNVGVIGTSSRAYQGGVNMTFRID